MPRVDESEFCTRLSVRVCFSYYASRPIKYENEDSLCLVPKSLSFLNYAMDGRAGQGKSIRSYILINMHTSVTLSL